MNQILKPEENSNTSHSGQRKTSLSQRPLANEVIFGKHRRSCCQAAVEKIRNVDRVIEKVVPVEHVVQQLVEVERVVERIVPVEKVVNVPVEIIRNAQGGPGWADARG